MNPQALQHTRDEKTVATIRKVALSGNLAPLTPEERLSYYEAYCAHLGVDPVTRPFDLIERTERDGKKVVSLYPNANCASQLAEKHRLSFSEPQTAYIEALGLLVIRVRCIGEDGRERWGDSALAGLAYEGEKLENAYKKRVTQAHRRAVFGKCGVTLPDFEPDSEGVRVIEVEPSPPLKLALAPVATLPPATETPAEPERKLPPDITDTKTANRIIELWKGNAPTNKKSGKPYELGEFLREKKNCSGLASLPASAGEKLLVELEKRNAVREVVAVEAEPPKLTPIQILRATIEKAEAAGVGRNKWLRYMVDEWDKGDIKDLTDEQADELDTFVRDQMAALEAE